MFALAARSSILLAIVPFTGCELAALVPDQAAERGLEDGAFCTEDADCASERCTTYQLCAHSTCNCAGDSCAETGDPSSDCSDDWVCTDNKNFFDGFREFFGGDPPENRGYCQAPCSLGCPEHYACSGNFCLPDPNWTAPIPTIEWSGGATGKLTGRSVSESVIVEENQTVTLRASASSPVDREIQSFKWILATAHGTVESDQATVELTIERGSFQRAELTVLDEKYGSGFAHVIFEPCRGVGQMCGYEGSGCCKGCDDATDSCL